MDDSRALRVASRYAAKTKEQRLKLREWEGLAAEMGREAYKAGKPVAPALNKRFLDLMYHDLKPEIARLFGENTSPYRRVFLALMDAYTGAWTKANLADPVW